MAATHGCRAATTTVPKYEYSIPEEAKYFVSIGVLPASAFDTTRMTKGVEYEINMDISKNGYLRIWATSGQLNTLVSYVTKTNAGLSGDVSRLTFAKVICQLTGRDTSPVFRVTVATSAHGQTLPRLSRPRFRTSMFHYGYVT